MLNADVLKEFIFDCKMRKGQTNINITKQYLQSMHDDDTLVMGARTSPLMNL